MGTTSPKTTAGPDGDRDTAGAYVRLRVIPVPMVGRLRWWIRLARAARGALREGVRAPAALRRLVVASRDGFLPESEAFYDLGDHRSRDYVSDRQREETWKLNWPAAGLLDDKLAFAFMLQSLGHPTPRVLAAIVRGAVHPLSGERPDDDGAWLRRTLEQHGRLIVRPTRGGGGRSLLVLVDTGAEPLVNGGAVAWEDLRRQVAALQDHLVTEFVQQAQYAQQLFPGATNTVRIVTLCPTGSEPFIAGAVHRLGTRASEPVDNWSRGGLSVDLDPASGILGRGVTKPAGGHAAVWHDRHPDTGAQLLGQALPGWESIRRDMLSLAAAVSFLPYVGWDVVVTDGGHSVIEGNKYTDVNLLQVHRPLMADPRVRDFFARNDLAAR